MESDINGYHCVGTKACSLLLMKLSRFNSKSYMKFAAGMDRRDCTDGITMNITLSPGIRIIRGNIRSQ